mmetsp:Transcript_27715/g.58242  ORF Transcript_27715/g.58242 Transcript_27715/m.58242 type:complete len:217 (+) Transcript_27715:296-946(+)
MTLAMSLISGSNRSINKHRHSKSIAHRHRNDRNKIMRSIVYRVPTSYILKSEMAKRMKFTRIIPLILLMPRRNEIPGLPVMVPVSKSKHRRCKVVLDISQSTVTTNKMMGALFVKQLPLDLTSSAIIFSMPRRRRYNNFRRKNQSKKSFAHKLEMIGTIQTMIPTKPSFQGVIRILLSVIITSMMMHAVGRLFRLMLHMNHPLTTTTSWVVQACSL